MDNRLMAKQDLNELGFKDKDEGDGDCGSGTSGGSGGERQTKTSKEKDQDRQKTGFVAGLQVAGRKFEK